MKTASRLRQAHESVVELCVNSAEFSESGTGIVLSCHPFRLLVPAHLIIAIEDGSAQDITIDEIALRNVTPLSSPILEQHELAVLQIDQPAPYHLRPIWLRRQNWVDAYPGQCGVLITPRLLSSHCRSGPIQTVHSDGKATVAVIDVSVVAGDSGSAVFIDGTFAGVVQGRQATEDGSKAIVILFSAKAAEELRQLAGIQMPQLPKLVKAGLLAFACLCIVSCPLPNKTLSSAKTVSSANTVPSAGGSGDYVCGAMPHAVEFIENQCFVAQMDAGILDRFDFETADCTVIANNLNQPCDMAVGASGSLFCVNESGSLMEIDVATGTLLSTSSLRDVGLDANDIVMGVETSQDGFIALFYRNEKPYLLLPEDGYSTIPLVAPATGELCGLQEVEGRFFTLAWQDRMICEIVRLDGVAHVVYALDIKDYATADTFASGGLRNFYIRENSLYLTSIYYGSPRPETATLHFIQLDAPL